ncbi:MAG: hypothetical protein AB1750_05860 [Chloroflexota bacterium]
MSSKSNRTLWIASASLLFALACSINLFSPTATPAPTATAATDATKIALELQATQMSLQLTQAVLGGGGGPPLTEPPIPPGNGPTQEPPPQGPPTIPPLTPTPDLQARMSAANILVYENTDERNIGLWIKDALDNLGLTYTHTGSYSGHFMEFLNSGAYYDLIIVGAEDKDIISGEFWDVINSRLIRDNAALIVEIWYLDSEANGPIRNIMSKCGIAYRKDYDLADSIYWWVPTHPVFNEPNQTVPLLHYSRYWAGQTGDQIRLTGTGDAVMLAGLTAAPGEGGVLATCMEGRVIFQTFSDHDYHEEDVVPLWENYIYNTLRAHFAVTP